MAATTFYTGLPWYYFGSVPASGSKTLTVSNSSRLLAFVLGVSTSCQGFYIINSNSTGGVSYSTVKSTSGIALSATTNNITFTNSTTSVNPWLYIVAFNGTVEIASS